MNMVSSMTDCIFNVAWGLTMAAFATNLRLETYGIELSKCMLGAFFLRSSACTINDIFDRKMDAGVGEYY
jgi:4-hydroxybenzoate polyprenyltransferase